MLTVNDTNLRENMKSLSLIHIFADEPPTALDVTIQAQILELMQDLQKKLGMAIIMVTHDLGVIAELCDEIIVLYLSLIHI